MTDAHLETAIEQQNCRHRIRINLATKCLKKSKYLTQNQKPEKIKYTQKDKCMNTTQTQLNKSAKQNSNQQYQNNKNAVKSDIIKHQNTTEIWSKTRHQKTHKSK